MVRRHAVVWGVAVMSAGVLCVLYVQPRAAEYIAKERHRASERELAPARHYYVLSRRVALAAKSTPAAALAADTRAATELLKLAERMRDDTDYGNAVHYGHIYLGRAALFANDLEAARKQLLSAGRTPGSPQLDDYGPDMTLAAELLRRGERDVVLQYFDLCDKFWTNRQRNRLDLWRTLVKEGKIPDFGPNSGSLTW